MERRTWTTEHGQALWVRALINEYIVEKIQLDSM